MINVTINTTIGNKARRPQHFTAPDRTAALDTINKNIRDLTQAYFRQAGLALDTVTTSDDGSTITLDLTPAITLFNPARVIYNMREV